MSPSQVKQVVWIEKLIQNMFIKYHGVCWVCDKKRAWQSREERGAHSSEGERWKELNHSKNKEGTVFACG